MEGGKITKKIQSIFRSVESKRKVFHGGDQNFIKNGKLLLEERVTLFHGKTIPLRCLSVGDLNTKFEDWILRRDFGNIWEWYQCVWEGRPVLVKLFRKNYSSDSENDDDRHSVMFCREIAVATQMSIHNNVHKLLACCLETKSPILIYEFIERGYLGDILRRSQDQMTPPLGWNDRLRIAWEISHAVAYLHSAFPRPIIHRDLNHLNVLLDKDNSAKLTGFHLSVCIPEGELHVVDVVAGTSGCIDPHYAITGMVAENVDVYAFGVLFLELLTGLAPAEFFQWMQPVTAAVRRKLFTEIVDPVIIRDRMSVNEDLQQQLQACIEIILKCVALEKDNRPTMEVVATELKTIITASEPFIPTPSTATLSQNLSFSHVQFESKRKIFHGSHQNFMKNERVLLEERDSLFRSKTSPICCLSIDDLNNNFKDWILHSRFGAWRWWQCVWEGRPVLAKLFEEHFPGTEKPVATQMSVHKNVHKLLACCLETEKPVLIYEFVENGCLHDVIFRSQNQMIPPLGWKDRLRIAWEVSCAVAFLHSAFPWPIIHGDLKPMNVYLGQDNAAKLANFSTSVSIPKGATNVEDEVIGTLGYYLDPLYFETQVVTESIDVYSFGVFCLVLLTGVRAADKAFLRAINWCTSEHFTESLDRAINENRVLITEHLQQQLQACMGVALNCISNNSRPTMEEVATELQNIITSSEPSTPTTSAATTQ